MLPPCSSLKHSWDFSLTFGVQIESSHCRMVYRTQRPNIIAQHGDWVGSTSSRPLFQDLSPRSCNEPQLSCDTHNPPITPFIGFCHHALPSLRRFACFICPFPRPIACAEPPGEVLASPPEVYRPTLFSRCFDSSAILKPIQRMV